MLIKCAKILSEKYKTLDYLLSYTKKMIFVNKAILITSSW